MIIVYGIDFEKKFRSGDLVNVLLFLVDIYGKRWVFVEGNYYFGDIVDVFKGRMGYIYIWVKFYYRYEKEYFCEGVKCSEIGRERIDVGIYDVKVSKGVYGYIIDGGVFIGSFGFDWIFFKFIKEGILYLFEENKGIILKYFLKGISGDCGVKFGIGIFVGVIVVVFGVLVFVVGFIVLF